VLDGTATTEETVVQDVEKASDLLSMNNSSEDMLSLNLPRGSINWKSSMLRKTPQLELEAIDLLTASFFSVAIKRFTLDKQF
jgi:hypothetical protein